MKRFYICIGLFVLIIALSFSSLFYIKSTVDEMSDMIADIKQSVKDSEYELTKSYVDDFSNLWHEREKLLVRIMRHSGIDSAENVVAQLPVLLEYKDYTMFMSTLSELEAIITRMWEDEIPNIKNIM